MAPYRILTPTVGLVERFRISHEAGDSSLDLFLVWPWWCRGWLRRLWLVPATLAAADILNRELGTAADTQSREPVWDDPREPEHVPAQAMAAHLTVTMGFGAPDDWRAVRWRDAVYVGGLQNWLNTPEKERGPRPVWGERPAP